MDNSGNLERIWEDVTLEQLPQVAAELWTFATPHRVWRMEGSMGAGKTTFIKAICAHIGVVDVVNSPTFALVNEYQTEEGDPIYHFDFYRMKHPREALDIGMEEYLDSGALCLLEWPSKVETLLPARHLSVSLTPTSAATRRIVCQRYE